MTAKKISKEEENESKIYRLWWEYLKRNDDYKEFCDFVRKNRKGNTIGYELFGNFQKLKGDKLNVNQKYGKFILHPLFTNYIRFTDVHTNDFEKWYIRHENNLERNRNDAVEAFDLTEKINSNVDERIKAFKMDHNDEEPTVQDLREISISDYMNTPIYLKIRICAPNTTDDLLRRIGKILKEKRCDPKIRRERAKDYCLKFSSTIVKDNYIRPGELERYLRVYDLDKQGLRMADIIKEIDPKKENTDVNVQRAFYQDLKRAKNIIENVGLGVFPGDYQPRRTKGLKTKTKTFSFSENNK
ncbi:MAG: hypothetical protein HW406_935 [Candidatus Brocadiaceae bacterium]|nr:hypothetical protein [Candidatus Brocadiaceae bacterium]